MIDTDWRAEALKQQELREKNLIRCLEMTERWLKSESEAMSLAAKVRQLERRIADLEARRSDFVGLILPPIKPNGEDITITCGTWDFPKI